MELASFAGAFERLVWVGPELTDEQVLEKFSELAETAPLRSGREG